MRFMHCAWVGGHAALVFAGSFHRRSTTLSSKKLWRRRFACTAMRQAAPHAVPVTERWDTSGREIPFKPLGYGNGKKESAIFADWANCYLASNDPYGETLHSILSLMRSGYVEVDRFVSVVGSFVALQFLLVLRPRAIHFFDMNAHQIRFAQLLCELIKISKSPQDFLSRVFARGVLAFERRLEGARGRRLSLLNQKAFMALPVSPGWRQKTLAMLSPAAQEVYVNVLQPLQDGDRPGWFTPMIRPCEDRRRLSTCTRTGLGAQGRLPGDGFASFLYGEGWLTSDWTFNVVKEKLSTVPITWTADVDFPQARRAKICPEAPKSGESTLVFTMDMWSSDFAKHWPRKRTLEWRPSAGRLAVIQSITAAKHELVQELVGDEDEGDGPEGLRWRSLSDWDSAALLPPHICQVGEVLHEGCRPQGEEGMLMWRRHPLVHRAPLHYRRLLRELTAPTPIPLRGRGERCRHRSEPRGVTPPPSSPPSGLSLL